MFRKYFFSIMIFICTFLFTLVPLSAQEEEGEIIIISERVGKEIDPEERDNFKLFQEVKGFQSAVYIKLSDNRYFLKITYLDEKTGKTKFIRVQQSEVSIKNRGNYIDRFEEIQAQNRQDVTSDTSKMSDSSKNSDIEEKDFQITPYLGLSTFVGTIGIEFQYKHFGFNIGDFMDGMLKETNYHILTGGIRYYFNSNKSSLFIGLGGGITLKNPNLENEPLCYEGQPDNYVCYSGHVIDNYIGIIFGYRWRLWKALNLNLGIGPNKVKWKKKWKVRGIEVGGKGESPWMFELAIGYSF